MHLFVVLPSVCQSLKASAEATDLLQSMKLAKERLERDLERLQNKEDSSDSLRRRLRETEVPHTHTHTHSWAYVADALACSPSSFCVLWSLFYWNMTSLQKVLLIC